MEKDGDCMYHAARGCLQIKEGTLVDKMYISRNVKHQAIAHFLEYRDQLVDEVEEAIRQEYGRVDSEFGPFSIKEYLQFMARPREYGDLIMLKLIASLWGLRITVIRSDSLGEIRIRHNLHFTKADMVFIYNSKPISGHYSPAFSVSGGDPETLEIVDKLVKGKNYDPEVDRAERRALHLWCWKEGSKYQDLESSDTDEEALKEAGRQAKTKGGKGGKSSESSLEGVLKEQKKMIEDLKAKVENLEKKSEVVDQIKRLVGGSGGSTRGEEEEEGQPVPKRRGFEPATQVQKVKKGDTFCKVCKKDLGSSTNLKRHVDKAHKRKYTYYCSECNRGFMKKAGYVSHMKTHDKEKLKCSKKDCKSEFSSMKAKKKHEKLHSLSAEIRCQFKGCNYSHKAKDYVLQHEKLCPYNMEKDEITCDVCGKGGFFLPKKLNEHKRLEHDW